MSIQKGGSKLIFLTVLYTVLLFHSSGLLPNWTKVVMHGLLTLVFFINMGEIIWSLALWALCFSLAIKRFLFKKVFSCWGSINWMLKNEEELGRPLIIVWLFSPISRFSVLQMALPVSQSMHPTLDINWVMFESMLQNSSWLLDTTRAQKLSGCIRLRACGRVYLAAKWSKQYRCMECYQYFIKGFMK